MERPGPKKKKKLTIKAYSVAPKLPPDFLESTWARLLATTNAVHREQPVSDSFETLYKDVEDLCSHQLGEQVYGRLAGVCDAQAVALLGALAGRTSDTTVFLELVQGCWQTLQKQLMTIRNIFLCLDRKWAIPAGRAPIWELGLGQFRAHLKGSAEVRGKVVEGLLTLIRREREGEGVDRQLLKSLAGMLTALEVFDLLREPLLQQTEAFYLAEAGRHIGAMPTAEYLSHAERRFAQENERVDSYLEHRMRKELLSTVQRRLVADHTAALVERGFDGLLRQQRVQDVRRMHALFSLPEVSGVRTLRSAFSSYIKRTGMELVTHEDRDAHMVEELLLFKERLDEFVAVSFGSELEFSHTLKESCENFINVRTNRPAELVAKHLDALLRVGNKGTTEAELDAKFDRLLELFRYVNGKDVFEAFYKKDLAKRLLLDKSASREAETSMLSKLKHECGNQFTLKLEGMFKDVDLSRELVGSFKQSSRFAAQLANIDLKVCVLTHVNWPTYAPAPANLPAELESIQESFKAYYLDQHTGRRLSYLNALGTCVLKAEFPSGKKELTVSVFQAVVLMLFNADETLTYEKILGKTGIEKKVLERTLLAIACGKLAQRVLRKRPEGREVNEGDQFEVNSKFTSKLIKVTINRIQLKETADESEKTNQAVMQDRQYQVDACVVRIMKMRRSLTHALLMSEIYKQLTFPIKPTALKLRIESLIDREYIVRDASNSQQYTYLA